MAFLTQRIIGSCLQLPSTIRASQRRATPDLVVLPVRDGCTPCGKPPVRIWLGTETAQYKAERVFVWSIEQVRDPTRVYEIYLMKHLFGFRSRFWLTGFTNYRFAIPHFAGHSGRAIYNDVDQVYLQDPADLFDLDMGDHGYLAVDAGDISVALFDCEQMSRIWTLKDAQTGRKNTLLARAKGAPGLWGKLAGGWNARDREYSRGACGVLHFTALHRQPWHPFPQLFVYQPNEAADVWSDLEQSANAAGFQVFSAEEPSQAFLDLRRDVQETGEQALSTLSARSDLAHLPENLAFVPDDDIPWLLEQLFCRAGQQLDCDVIENSRALVLPGGARLRPRTRTREWWQYQLEIVGRHHPGVHWRLRLFRDRFPGRNRPLVIEGNECKASDTVVWVLANRKPGHTSQAMALAAMLGWHHEEIRVPQRLKALLLVLLRCNFGTVMPLRPPWPNIIVACGWWPTRVARWVQRRSGGRVRLLLAGRKCGPVKSPTDILVSCQHFHLPVHERRIEVLLPVQPVAESGLDAARKRGQQLLGSAPSPRVVLLVGGSAKQHVLSPADAARLGRLVLGQVEAAGGSLFAVTSRRTGDEAATALQDALQGVARIHRWLPDEVANPYPDLLAAADIIVVTGESESMLTDAIVTGKPVYIYPLRKRRYGPWLTLGARLFEWSGLRLRNRRGTERPQQGFQYLCGRILKSECILPPRDLDALHRRLVERGSVQMFGQSLSLGETIPVPPWDDLGDRLRVMLAQSPDGADAHVSNPFSRKLTIEA
jgi:uncharacterized protein